MFGTTTFSFAHVAISLVGIAAARPELVVLVDDDGDFGSQTL